MIWRRYISRTRALRSLHGVSFWEVSRVRSELGFIKDLMGGSTFLGRLVTVCVVKSNEYYNVWSMSWSVHVRTMKIIWDIVLKE